MINLTINGQPKQIKNLLTELNILEFEQLCAILNENIEDVLDRYIKIFQVLGLSESDIDDMDTKEFLRGIKEYGATLWEEDEFKREVVVKGKKYSAFTGDKFTLSVRDLAKIEKYIKQNGTKYMGELLAVIYKDTSADKSLHYDEKHISYKADLFRKNMKADVILPYLNLILHDVVDKLKDGKVA